MDMSSSEATDELCEQDVSSLVKLPPLLQPTPTASQGIPEALTEKKDGQVQLTDGFLFSELLWTHSEVALKDNKK